MYRLITAFVAATMSVGAAQAGSTAAPVELRQPRSLLAMSPAAFRSATIVQDDPLESHATLSTEKAHRERWTWLKPDGHDNHLRAIVDKTSGATHYEVRTTVRYFGTQRDYRSAHFATEGGLRRAELSLARHGRENCATNDNNFNCALTKTIAFTVDEDVIRAIAARHAVGKPESWRFKLKDDGGNDIVSGIVPAEAAGLLDAVDGYRSTLRLS